MSIYRAPSVLVRPVQLLLHPNGAAISSPIRPRRLDSFVATLPGDVFIGRRVFGTNFDEPLARQDGSGTVQWYGRDHLGSVRQVFDNSTGAAVSTVDFDASGVVLSGTRVDRYGFTGREWDDTLGLQYSRARMYNPATGRWLQEDPLGHGAGDSNLYRYVGNDPKNWIDPSGLAGVETAGVDGVSHASNPHVITGPYREEFTGPLLERGPYFEDKSGQPIVLLTKDDFEKPLPVDPEKIITMPPWNGPRVYHIPLKDGSVPPVLIKDKATYDAIVAAANQKKPKMQMPPLQNRGIHSPPLPGPLGPYGPQPVPKQVIPKSSAPDINWPVLGDTLARGLPLYSLYKFLDGVAEGTKNLLKRYDTLRGGGNNQFQSVLIASLLAVQEATGILGLYKGYFGVDPWNDRKLSLFERIVEGAFGLVQAVGTYFGLRGIGLRAPGAVPVKPTVQPGAIGLGLDHNLRDLGRMGATTYDKWFESGLTRVRPEQANLSPFKFKQAFTDAAGKAPQIVFDITDLDVAKALADGSKGFVSKNYTNAELHHIVTNEGLLGKTTFVNKGQVVKPVIQDGKVVGFAP